MPDRMSSLVWFSLFMVFYLLVILTENGQQCCEMRDIGDALKGYVAVVVTGGSSGIGKSLIGIVGKLAPHAVICNLSRRFPEIIFPANFRGKLLHFPCDLGRAEEVPMAVEKILRVLREEVPTKGKVLLVNNSGFGGYGEFPEAGVEAPGAMVDVNVRAVVELTAGMLEVLKERGGAIVNMASLAAFQPTAYMATYGATKAFVLSWSLALREELRGSGVEVVTVCPGPTESEFFLRAGLEKGSVGFGHTSEDVAVAILRGVAKGRAVVVPGVANKLLRFAAGVLPVTWTARVGAWALRRYRLKQVRKN